MTRPLLDTASRYLHSLGIPDSQAEAEFLLAFTLKVKRTEIHMQEMPAKPVQAAYQKLLKERGKTRKPLAFIMGYEEFMGLRFKVEPKATLIPRPETESLVDVCLQYARHHGGPLNLMDVGAGSGCVGISLLKMLEGAHAHLTAVEFSPRTAAILKENVKAHGIAPSNINIIKGFFQDLNYRRQFDLIAANLPYISQKEMKYLQPEIKLWEPPQALCGGPDGLLLVRQLMARAPGWLKKGGALALELSSWQTPRVKRWMIKSGFKNVKIHNDLQKHPRVVMGELA